MKKILKLIIFSALLLVPNISYAQATEDIAEDLLTTPQENEIVLQTNDTLFDEKERSKEKLKEQKYHNGLQNNTAQANEKSEQTEEKHPLWDALNAINNNNEDDSVMDNVELDFEVFKLFDKNNDKKIDEDTIPGKIIHSKITRTDVQSFLLKDDLSFEYKKGPLHKIQVYGGYRGSVNALFSPTYSTKYDNLTTELGVYGSLRNPDYKFKFNINPIPVEGMNIADRLFGDAYIMNTSLPHHQIVAGYSRVQTGIEGGASTFILPFVARSQIARNFGNTRSLSVKVIGNYNYIDYNLAFGSSGRYITSGMPGVEFNGWLNVKPFGSHDGKYGKLTIGGGFNGGHNQINYGIGSVYVAYKHKKLWANFEAAIADGYNGSQGVSENKACGYAATVGWKFTPHLQLIGRIDQFDPNRDASNDLKREYTVGINWFIKGQALKVVLNYVFCQNQNTEDSHKLILATQILL